MSSQALTKAPRAKETLPAGPNSFPYLLPNTQKNGRTYLSHPSSRAECTRAELFSQLRTVARVRPHRLDTKKKFISFWQTTVRRTLLSHSRKSAHPNILSSSFSGINQLCRVNFILAGLCFLFTVNVQSQKRRSSTELESVVNWKTEPVACVCVAASVFFPIFGVMFTHVLDSDCRVIRQ